MNIKDAILYFLILTLSVVVLFQTQCNGPEKELKDNSELFKKLKVLQPQLDSLELLAGNLTVELNIEKERKDSIIIRLKPKYITITDTITGDIVDCLPKEHVDTLIRTYEGLLDKADKLSGVKDNQILNLEEQSTTKDNIITNLEENEETLKQTLKKEKGKKWKFGGVGVVIGYVIGKVF